MSAFADDSRVTVQSDVLLSELERPHGDAEGRVMCGTRAVRAIVASLVAVLVLNAVPAYSWDRVRGVTALALDPQAPSAIYAGTFDRGLFKSTDGGAEAGMPRV